MKLLFATILITILLTSSVLAGTHCKDLEYGTDKYHENMDELAKKAKLEDNYWHRYHEAFISDLCRGNKDSANGWVDCGHVKASDAVAISKLIGKPYKVKKRTATGLRFERAYYNSKLLDMLCTADASNLAMYYAMKPFSKCGKLVERVLRGDRGAIKIIKSFGGGKLPGYCQWRD